MFSAWRRRNWIRTEGRVIDSLVRTVRRTPVPLHNYIVEFRSPNGELTRLEVEQRASMVQVFPGSDVPLLVSPDATKAVFDEQDPRINVNAYLKAAEERFRSQLKR